MVKQSYDDPGQPTKMTAENRSKVLAYLSMGRNFTAAAALAGMSRQTLRVWRKQDSEFSAECDRASANCATMPLVAVIECMRNEPTNIGTDAAPVWQRPFSRQEQMKACKWYLEHRTDEFKPKQDVTIGAKTSEEQAHELADVLTEIRGSVQGPDFPVPGITNGVKKEMSNGHSKVEITVHPGE